MAGDNNFMNHVPGEGSAGRSGKSEAAFRTISEVSADLGVPQHVLRFWETRFTQIRPMKRGGGRRYYRPEDVRLLEAIRDLLYNDGYTIRGAQKFLREHGVKALLAQDRHRDTEAADATAGDDDALALADEEGVFVAFSPAFEDDDVGAGDEPEDDGLIDSDDEPGADVADRDSPADVDDGGDYDDDGADEPQDAPVVEDYLVMPPHSHRGAAGRASAGAALADALPGVRPPDIGDSADDPEVALDEASDEASENGTSGTPVLTLTERQRDELGETLRELEDLRRILRQAGL